MFQLHDNQNYLIILPNNQKIIEILVDQQVLMINKCLYLLDKNWKVHYPIICNDQKSIEINSTMQANIFLDDDLWTVVQPDKEKRFYAIKTFMSMMQQTTQLYGCNLIFACLDNGNYSAALTSTPPGISSNYFSSFKSLLYVYDLIKYFNWKNIFSLNQINKIHQKYCKNINNHMYICGIVTDNEYRRQGLGKEIFKLIYSITNQSSATIYLENSKQINLFFYTSVGLTPQCKYLCQNSHGQKSTIYIMTSTQNEQFQLLNKYQIQDKLVEPDLVLQKGIINFY